MSLSEPVELVRRLGAAQRVGAIVMMEHAVDTYVAGYTRIGDRAVALDILLRDLARLRVQAPNLDRIIGEVESYIDLLHRDLARRAA
jgi:hypothetical protein